MDKLNCTANEKIDEIWLFVEDRLNTSVPTYVKNILKVCGYNNGITIASIVEEDITYFEAEVRNGNVSNFFVGSKETDFLEGSTKNVKNFEFVRGHKKFLLFIVDFLKNHLEENGVDSLRLTQKSSKKFVKSAKQNAGQKVTFPWQRKNILKVDTPVEFEIATGTEKLSYLTVRKSDVEEVEIITQKSFSTKTNEDLKPESLSDDKQLLRPDEAISSETESDPPIEFAITTKTEKLSHPSDVVDAEICTQKYVSTKINEDLKPEISPKKSGLLSDDKQLLRPDEAISAETESDPPIEFAITTKTEKLSHPIVRNSDVLEAEIFPQKYVSTKINEDIQPDISSKESGSLTDDKQSLRVDETKSDSYQVFDEKQFEKLGGTSIVCYCGREIRVKEYIDAAMSSCVAGLEAPTSSSTDFSKKKLTIKTPEVNQIYGNLLIPGSYVIYSMCLKNSIRWPNKKPIVKNFVGQVRRLEHRAGNRRNDDEIELLVMKSNPYKRSNFTYSENCETTTVSRKNILEILHDPVKNRRGEFVFKDKLLLDYIFD